MHIPIVHERQPCLDEQGRARGGSVARNPALRGKEFAVQAGRVAMRVIEGVLRMRRKSGRW